MARIEWVDQRLTNWALWKIGSRAGGLGYATVNLQAPPVDNPTGWDAQARIPVDDAEAAVTDEGVRTLPSELRRTVEVFYIDPGSVATKLKKLACERATLNARIETAHRKLSSWFGDRDRQAQAERARVEALQSYCNKDKRV
jgi:hypothetical protein